MSATFLHTIEHKKGVIGFSIRIVAVRGGFMYGYDIKLERFKNGSNQYADVSASVPYKTVKETIEAAKQTMLYILVKVCCCGEEEMVVFKEFCAKRLNEFNPVILLLC